MQDKEPPRAADPGRRRRRNRWRVLAILLIALTLAPASFLARRGVTRLDYFHLRSVQIEGTRYLKPETVLQRLGVDTATSVLGDTEMLAARVRVLPQVRNVEISRKMPGTLIVRIDERVPVAFVSGPRGLEAVDSTGLVLPIDPREVALDLPIAETRDKPLLAYLGAVQSAQPAVYGRISEVSRDGREDVLLRLAPPPADEPAAVTARADDDSLATAAPRPSVRLLPVRVRLGVSVSRLADIFPVEFDLARRGAKVAELDLRYRDQVIARLQ